MKILVIGSGGREHALAWKIAQSARVTTVFVAPGNAGTAIESKCVNIPQTTIPELIEFVQKEHVDLTVVGPEIPLALGIVDAFRQAKLKIFGPTQLAAQLESSKDFAKAFMIRHHIPTAAYQTFTDPQSAHAYVIEQGVPIVIKADGLAAGKGVVVAQTEQEAHAAIDDMLLQSHLGNAGSRVVIEEYLTGTEASFIVMVDGQHIFPLASSQDHKRLGDKDQGPNTGGMGAISPAPIVTAEIHQKVMEEIIIPAVQGLQKDGISFTGFLYAGLMIDAHDQIKVLEFNCRMGDPETQAIVFRLNSDFVSLLEHGINGTLDQAEAKWDKRSALTIVLASQGYPLAPRKGDIITGLPIQKNNIEAHVFHSGTKFGPTQEILTNSGRVLCLSALGENLMMAQENAYSLIKQIRFEGLHYRTDIGTNAINLYNQKALVS